jgi:hypothetical protein
MADIPYSREHEAVGIDLRRHREERRPERYPGADTREASKVSVKERFSETADDVEDHDLVTPCHCGKVKLSARAAKSFNSQKKFHPGTGARQMSHSR